MPEAGVRHPLVELTIVRTKEFLRETEAIFWVFGFPLLLALALGFAFRVEAARPHSDRRRRRAARAAARMRALAKSPALLPRLVPRGRRTRAAATGKISLLIEGDATPVYRLRSDASRRANGARRSRRRAAEGRGTPRRLSRERSARHRAGIALHRLPDARPHRHEPDVRPACGGWASRS